MGFQGDKKFGQSILNTIEIRFRDWLIPMVPRRVESYHLTLTTILWSALIVVFSFLAKYNIHWLWLVSLMIFMQYITDLLDGAIGRARDTGLVKWGYYMDHFLDYIFLSSILIGYALLLPDVFKYRLFFVMAFFGAFMVNSFLSFAATNKLKISYLGIGPTEVRLVFMGINTLLLVIGRSAWVLVPPEMGYASTLTDGELRSSIIRDEQSFLILSENVRKVMMSPYSQELLAKPVTRMTEDERTAVRALWRDFVEACMELEILKRRYRGFYHVDYLVNPGLHADAFFIAYGAFVTQYESSLLMSERISKNDFLGNTLNEAMPEYDIPANSYRDMHNRMMHADELLRLNAGFVYLKCGR